MRSRGAWWASSRALGACAQNARLLPLVVGYTLGLFAHLRCRPQSFESVTRYELVIIFCGIAAALAAAVLLEPMLAWSVLAAALIVALELRLAVAPAQSPAA